MAVAALTTVYFAVAASTTGGTAPGGATAPTGCSLSSAVDLSAWTVAVETGSDVETKDSTTFGSGGYTAMVAALKKGKAAVTLLQDFAASATNATLGLNGSVAAPGGSFFLEIRPTSSSRSATNPGFICKVVHNGWRPLNARVGEIPTVAMDLAVTGGYAELTS